MTKMNNFFTKRFDGIVFLVIFFLFSLSMLFVYLQNIDKNITYYKNYQTSILKLYSYNQKLDTVFIRSYRYLDNDYISGLTKKFEDELMLLEKNILYISFTHKANKTLKEIVQKYMLKIDFTERFKTVNARIIHTMYALHDISKYLDSQDHAHAQIEGLLGDILFEVGQVLIDSEWSIKTIEEHLRSLMLYTSLDKEIKFFYKQSQHFIKDVYILRGILEQNKNLELDKIITQMNKILSQAYDDNHRQESMIGRIFFILAVLILLVLIYIYTKVLKNKKDIYHLAYHDILTDLPNRTAFEEKISFLIDKDKQNFSVLFIDLDRFKVINDTLGHDIGDEMLIVLARRIFKVLGSDNFLSRIGGDEFVALIYHKEEHFNHDKIVNILEDIAKTIREPMKIKEYSLYTTASIGIAMYPKDGKDKATLLKHADSAMYHAKDLGRDTYAFYNKALSVTMQRRLDLEQELIHGLENKEFSLHFQPQYDLFSNKIIGAEALVRWHNAVLGQVSPEEFIAVAEDTGMIVELGYFILREACKTYKEWEKEGISLPLIAINISSVQLRQSDAFEQFQKIINETKMNASHIEIELTERYIMEYTTQRLTILDDLRNIGCKISIDDFGTGYSSMSYLKSLEIDTIKIDKSFIMDLLINQDDLEVAKAIIVLSQSLGYKVVAEGIETLEQESLLRDYACDMGQGYYFAKPMTGEKFIAFFKNHVS